MIGLLKWHFVILFLFHAATCISQQKVLLIGTLHQTPEERLKEIIPVASAVENFHPGLICVEYPMPTDTASIKYKGGENIFQEKEALQREWKIPSEYMNTKIELPQQPPYPPSDIQKRMELQQLYFLLSDVGNADYQGYLIMTTTEMNSRNAVWLPENSPGFKTMKTIYEIKRYRNDEYHNLVFPLAARSNISYVYPIDDLGTWKEYEKYYDRVRVPNDTDTGKIKFHQYEEDFLRKLQSLPKDSNQWIFFNSPEIILNAIYGMGYAIDPDISNPDIKMLHYYWVQRNRIMAQHIYEVAHKHPDKRVVVFFGAAHVGPVREELNKLNKNLQVLTLLDVMR
jgi:hypothetical protein